MAVWRTISRSYLKYVSNQLTRNYSQICLATSLTHAVKQKKLCSFDIPNSDICTKPSNIFQNVRFLATSAQKSSIRFTCTVKEKGGSNTKKALNNLLFHKGINNPLQNEWHSGPNPLTRPAGEKSSAPGRGKKPRDKKTKRWHRQEKLEDDFGIDANNPFDNKWRDWWINQSQKASYSRDSKPGFEWTEGWNWTTQSQRNKTWNDESSDEPLIVGSRSERTVLGLPLVGPLKIDVVKSAFRSSALKWHPDKHQGPSQVSAQEKFKLCVDAYKSLCSALS